MTQDSADAKVELRGLAKRYGPVTALQPTSLKIRPGEFLTLLGPSGSGKTTLLQLIAGLLDPTEGTLLINGFDATGTHPSKRDFGMVFQNYALFPHLTVFENIAFPLRMRKLREAEVEAKVADILKTIRLSHTSNRLPKELSGGQQQRIALARCLVYSPSVILMDEPLGALDKKLRDHLQIEIKSLHRNFGSTIVYVTHDQEEALSMSDRICLMRDGAIAQLGSPKELYFNPKSDFVADFLGQMNLLAAEVEESFENRSRLRIKSWSALAQSRMGRVAVGPAKLLIRPEKVFVGECPPDVDTRLTGRVTDISQVGSVTRLLVAIDDDLRIAAQFFSEQDDRGLVTGQQVNLGWRSADALALPITM